MRYVFGMDNGVLEVTSSSSSIYVSFQGLKEYNDNVNKMEPQTVKPALKVKNLRVADEVVVAEALCRVVLQEALENIPQLDADLAIIPFADQLSHYCGLIPPRHLKMRIRSNMSRDTFEKILQ